jgi:hypothetical protein
MVVVVVVAASMAAVVMSRHVDVHVLGARREGAEVIGEILERARFVRAEERDDVLEARRCAVPFFFGRAFAARAVEEHAEAARQARLFCLFFIFWFLE